MNKAFLNTAIVFIIFSAQQVFAQQPQYKIGVSYGSSLFAHKEQFVFMLNGDEKITLDSANYLTAWFTKKLPTGTAYKVTQVSGPRTCNIWSNEGIVGNEDVVLTADCGTAPTTIFKIALSGIEAGETFSFADGYGRSLQTSFNVIKNLGAFPIGDHYNFTQTVGPRTCTFTNATGTVGTTSITIGCDCSKAFTPPPVPANTYDLISRSTDNKVLSSYYESWAPVISGKNEDEGRYVAFTMYGKGVDGSSGNYRQVFWRDRKDGITKMISKNAAGEEGDGNSFAPSISADGKSIVFETYARNLSVTDGNATRDVYLWNQKTGILTHISKSNTGETGNAESYEPVISGDGNTIAYTSSASNIVTLEPVFNTPNVFVYDVGSGSTSFITKDFETGKAASGYAPCISDDGTKIAFCAYTNKLVKNDNNNLWDIFLWERGAAQLKRISVPSVGAERDQGDESSSRVVWPNISGDGSSIVFATTSTSLVGNDKNGKQDIFLYNTITSSIKKVSTVNNTIEGDGDSPIGQGEKIGINYTGEWITYNTNSTNFGVPKGNIVVQNTKTGKLIPVTSITAGSTARPMLSRHGYFVVAGCSESYDKRFASSGLFTFYINLNK